MMVMWYSGGMKRRLSVAVALIGQPKVVYLDEPSTGQICDVKSTVLQDAT
jgi:ABC-type multidrug transport system ATPase subunit